MIKRNVKTFCIWALTTIGILSAVFVLYSHKTPSNSYLVYEGKQLPVSIADTPALQEHGLSDTASLPIHTGMFFVFSNPGMYGFWMKDMQYPLDIIWLDAQFHIITIQENLSPETYPHVFYPDSNAQYVLEINTGESKYLHLTLGGTFEFHKK